MKTSLIYIKMNLQGEYIFMNVFARRLVLTERQKATQKLFGEHPLSAIDNLAVLEKLF